MSTLLEELILIIIIFVVAIVLTKQLGIENLTISLLIAFMLVFLAKFVGAISDTSFIGALILFFTLIYFVIKKGTI